MKLYSTAAGICLKIFWIVPKLRDRTGANKGLTAGIGIKYNHLKDIDVETG